MNDSVKIVECPRDAWQALPAQIPAKEKADYLQQLITAGFRHIDAVSFVSPAAVPQMADSEKVLELVEAVPALELIGIVVNRKGAERAISTGSVHTLGFPFSISTAFSSPQSKSGSRRIACGVEGDCCSGGARGVGCCGLSLDGLRQSLRRSVEPRTGC